MKNTKRFIAGFAAVVGVAAVCGVLAGSVFGRSAASSTGPSAAVASVQVASYSSDSKYGAWITRTADGKACLLDGPKVGAGAGGGCNPRGSALAGRQELALFSFEGGPALGSITGARVVGLVTARVSRIAVVFSDGSTRNLPLVDRHTDRVLPANYRVFAAEFDVAALRAGVAPRDIVAFAASGKELQRQDIGSDLRG